MNGSEVSSDIEWLGDGDRMIGEARWATLEAAVARIVPTDHDPGAREAGTIHYVLSQARHDAPTREGLVVGADLLEQLAQEGFGAGFTQIGSESQDSLLARLDAQADPFFLRLVTAVMEGFYGDPRYGGNQGGVSWTMIGFPGPRHPRGWSAPLGWYDEHISDEMAG